MDTVPFHKDDQLNVELSTLAAPRPALHPHPQPDGASLPGYPRILLTEPQGLCAFLHQEFDIADLEQLAPRLWMMSRQSSSSISPLHRQKVKGREIIVTEDPRLHLVWYYDRIFIKPLPKYLLSHDFWLKYLISTASPLGSDRARLRRSALGYLRTYFYLIKHESDFRVATSERLRLVPENITWEQFCRFSATFDHIQDSEVSARYAYGELRLSRLNLYSKLFLRKLHFQRVNPQYGTYFARFYGPLLFTFGVLSVLLNAMQVELTVEQQNEVEKWISFWLVCRWFSISCLAVVVSLSLCLAFLFMVMFTKEWIFAVDDRLKRRRKVLRQTVYAS